MNKALFKMYCKILLCKYYYTFIKDSHEFGVIGLGKVKFWDFGITDHWDSFECPLDYSEPWNLRNLSKNINRKYMYLCIYIYVLKCLI